MLTIYMYMSRALLTDIDYYVITCPAHGAKYDVSISNRIIKKPQVRLEVILQVRS